MANTLQKFYKSTMKVTGNTVHDLCFLHLKFLCHKTALFRL